MAKGRIAIVGNVQQTQMTPDNLPLKNTECIREAAGQIGAALARAGYGLVVYSAEERFVERYVVEGYLGTGVAQPRSIDVVYSAARPNDPKFPHNPKYENCFDRHPQESEDWEIAFYKSLEGVDGIVLIGGGRSTLLAGVLAETFRIPLLAISHFGGNAERVWNSLNVKDGLITPEARQEMGLSPTGRQATCWVESLRSQAKRRARRGQSKSTSVGFFWVLLAALVICLSLGVVLINAGNPNPIRRAWWVEVLGWLLLFVVPLVGGALGGILGLVHTRKQGRNAQWAVPFGTLAGFVVGVSYFAPLAINGSLPGNIVWWMMAAVLAIGGGYGADSIIEKLVTVARDTVSTATSGANAGQADPGSEDLPAGA